ncbi:winged helix-turn-helix domain-containing protein, partial [Helicobacter pylori]
SESINPESSNKSIDVIIGRLRSKIEKNPKQPQYIISVRGIGYKLGY